VVSKFVCQWTGAATLVELRRTEKLGKFFGQAYVEGSNYRGKDEPRKQADELDLANRQDVMHPGPEGRYDTQEQVLVWKALEPLYEFPVQTHWKYEKSKMNGIKGQQSYLMDQITLRDILIMQTSDCRTGFSRDG
jgi:hypothetical protein